MGIQFWLRQKNHGLFLLHVRFLYIKINYLCAIGLNDTHELFCNFSFIWKTRDYIVSGKMSFNVGRFSFLAREFHTMPWIFIRLLKSFSLWMIFSATRKCYLMLLNFSMSLLNEKFHTQSWPFYALDCILHLMAFWCL